jgi:hypothetical protein
MKELLWWVSGLIIILIILSMAYSAFPGTVFYLWLLIGILTSFIYKTKIKQILIIFFGLTLVAAIGSMSFSAYLESIGSSDSVLHNVIYFSIGIAVIISGVLVYKIFQISKQQNSFPIMIKNLSVNDKFILGGLLLILFLCIITTISPLKKIQMLDSDKAKHEEKKQNIDNNYKTALSYVKKNNWGKASLSINDVIEVDPNYKNTQKISKIISSNLAKLELQEKIKQQHTEKIAAITAPKEAKINKWFSNKEAEEQDKRRAMEDSEPELAGKGHSSYYFWPDKITWLDENYTKAKVIGVEKIGWPNGNEDKTKVIYIFTFSDSELIDAEMVLE